MTVTQPLARAVPSRSRALALLLAGLVPLAVLVVGAGRTPVQPAVAVLLPGYALAALAVRRHPRAGVVIGTAFAIATPIYYGRYAIGTLAITPVITAALLLLPLALSRRHLVRLGALDLAVGVFVLLRVVSLLLNYATGVGAVGGLLLGVALPYVVLRLLTARADPALLAGVVVAAGAALSVVAIGERTGQGNPFFTWLPATYQPELAHPSLRLGVVRAEGSFGDPIGFGMFLALALVLGVCLAVTGRTASRRVACLAADGLILYGLTATQSRGALLVAVVGITGWLVLTRRLAVLRLGVLVAAVAVVAVTTPALNTVLALADSSTGDTRESRSASYRLEILDVVRDPNTYSLLGQRTEDTGGVTLSVSSRVGLKSLDSEFALLYFASGVLGALAFTAIVVLVLRVGAMRGLHPLERAWVVGVGASYLNLLTVALFTQEAGLLWGWTALTASVAQRVAHQRSQAPRDHEERLTRWTP